MRFLLILLAVLLGSEFVWTYRDQLFPDLIDYFHNYFNKPPVLMPFCAKQPLNAETRYIQQYIPSYADQVGCDIRNVCIEGGAGNYYINWSHPCNFEGHQSESTTFTCQKNPTSGHVCCSPVGYGYMFMGCD